MTENEIDEAALVPTVPWPQLDPAALQGVAGDIVTAVGPHTEADPAALLVQLLAVFGCTAGRSTHIKVGNDVHPMILHPVIVGRTSSGAKGTSYGVINAIRRRALPEFDDHIVSGLSSAEGCIELVRDGTPADEANADNYDGGVEDKRLLIKETEYRSVLTRSRREGNTLGTTLRQAWDGETLRTLARKHNRLIASDPHIVVIGHITPREFRETLCSSDLSGGSVNRLLICLSRRSKLHSRFGNVPDDVISKAATLFKAAHSKVYGHEELRDFTPEFWTTWDRVYRRLNREQPESDASDASARGVPMVLRSALIYSALDQASVIGKEHLDAAVALWKYCEHSVRWLFSSHELELKREAGNELACYIRGGGAEGRTRTEISNELYKRNKSAAEIDVELAPLVHDGTIIEIQEEGRTRPTTKYVHLSVRTNEFTKNAGHKSGGDTKSANYQRTQHPTGGDSTYPFVETSRPKNGHDLRSSSDSFIRESETVRDAS